jgi:PAS domain S-box-containing protein
MRWTLTGVLVSTKVLTPQQTAVLHVDDQPDCLEITRDFLTHTDAGLSVHSTTCVTEAFDWLETHPIDCIVSDYDMPDVTGLEFRAELADRGIDLPFILFTGKGSEEIASEAISVGVTDYLQKGSVEQYELLAHSIRNSTHRYRTERHIRNVYDAIDLVGDGISLLDANGEFTYVNRAYAEIFGYTREELLGEHWSVLYRNEADVRYMQEHIEATLEPGESWDGRTLQARKDGTLIETEHSLAYTDDGAIVCLISAATETQRQGATGPIVN